MAKNLLHQLQQKSKKKQILCYPKNSNTNFTKGTIKTATESIPEWYKQITLFMNNGKKLVVKNRETNGTIKACVPFLDALTSGYVITLTADILVTQENGQPELNWTAKENLVSTHLKEQLKNFPIPEGYNELPFKWENYYGLQTPKNYSLLFTHPLNQNNLPFLTLSGVVDTDGYTIPTNFPFLIKEGFEGIIPKGTPIVQFLPIKREKWKINIKEYSQNYNEKSQIKLASKVFRSYKTQWWNRKVYE